VLYENGYKLKTMGKGEAARYLDPLAHGHLEKELPEPELRQVATVVQRFCNVHMIVL